MASTDIFNNSVMSINASDGSESSLSPDSSVVEPLTLDDIKIFEAMELDNGVGNEAIIEGALEEPDSMLENATQLCKKCKWVTFHLYMRF